MKIAPLGFLVSRRSTLSVPGSKPLGLAAAFLAAGTLAASAATYTYTGSAGDGQYLTAGNWSGNVVPNTSNGDTAIINNGAAVTYTPGGDLVIKNGGLLQVTSGSFTQAVGNNYIQLNGNGTILVNGGTFNQGTASSTPFSLNGTTGNAFTVTAGTVNFSTSFNINVGLTYSQSGGTINVAAANETDFNGGSATLSGGTLITRLITGQNGSTATRVFNISGGTLQLGTTTDTTYIYGPGPTQYVNFTLNSTGLILLANANATVAQAQGLISSSGIEYNNTAYNATTGYSNFAISKDPNTGYVSIALAPALVPEPSTYAALLLGAAGLMGWTIRRRSARANA